MDRPAPRPSPCVVGEKPWCFVWKIRVEKAGESFPLEAAFMAAVCSEDE
jgi:hypothetical protein